MKILPFAICYFLGISSLFSQDLTYESDLNAYYEKIIEYQYAQKDSAYTYLAKTYALAAAHDDWENEFWLLVQWNESAAYFYDLKTWENKLGAMDSLALAQKEKIKDSPDRLEIENYTIYYRATL